MSAPAELVIEVTAEDIRLGIPGDTCRCPVALAATRALGDRLYLVKVEEDANGMQVSLYGGPGDPEPDAACVLPADALRFVADFDAEREVVPFTFTARLGAAS